MADDPFATLGQSPAADPFGHLGGADPFGNLGRTDLPAVSTPSVSTLGSLVRHPVATLSDYASRVGEGFRAPSLLQSVGSLASDAGVARDAGGGAGGAAAVSERRDYERSTAPRPARNLFEGSANLLGSLAGGLRDPTSYIAPEIKGLTLFKGPFANALAGHFAGGAITGAGLNNLQQGIDISRQQREAYSPGEVLTSSLLQGGLGAAGHGLKVFQDASRDLSDAIEPWRSGQMEPARPKPAAPKPEGAASQSVVSLQDLWGRLIHQESGGDQGAVSSKGARGAAQLMPDTAADVARRIKRPELAALALEDSPRGRQANEYLGQIYLAEQMETFGDPALALAAYNAGPGRVHEWLGRFGSPDQLGRGTWIDMIPFDETRNYVRNILGDAAGGPGKITPEMAQLRESLRAEPEEAPQAAPAPTAAEKALATADEPAPDLSAHAEPAQPAAAPHAQPVSEELTQDLHDDNDFPFDYLPPSEGVERADAPSLSLPSITDQALDHMRAGTRPKVSSAPSLLEALVDKGGVRDTDGELGGKGEDRFLKQLRRVNTGMDPDKAALWAQEQRYIGGDLDHGHPRVTPNELWAAIRREVAGDKVYPEHALDHEAQMVADHMRDLDEEGILAHIGMDPRTHSNAEIRAAMDRMFSEPEHLPETVGLGRVAATGGEAVQRARAARERMAQREAILGMVDPATGGARLPGNRQAGAVPMPASGNLPPLEASFAQIWRNLNEALDVPVRQGRIGLRKALGTFNRKSGVVRVQGVHDVGVLSHELAHAMEFTKKYPTLQAEMAKHAKILKTMDYDPRAARRHEGFAEFMRWYVVNPEFAKQRAPLFYDAFERAIAHDDPRVFEALKLAQGHYDAFLGAPSLQSAAASIVRRGDISLAKSFINVLRDRGAPDAVGMLWKEHAGEAYRGVIDQLDPWRRATERLLDIAEANTGIRPRLPAAYDPFKLMRQLPAVWAAGHMDMMHGVHPYQRIDPDSPSLAEALQLALGDTFRDWDTKPESLANQFDAYLIGRRVRHDYDRVGQPGGLPQPPDQYSREYWDRVIMDAEAAHPEWAQAASMIYDWNNALWRKRHEAGFLTDEQYQEGLANNPDYVPLYRDLSDTKGTGGGPASLDNKFAGGARRRKGSTRAYMSPVESMMQNAYTLNAQIARNDALQALDDMGRMFGPDAGRVVERLPAKEVKPIRVGLQEVIENLAKEQNLSARDRTVLMQTLDDMFGEDANTRIYRAEDMREKAEPILYVWRDGKRIPLRLPDGEWGKHMVEAFAGATPAMRGMIFEALAIPARLVRAGTTVHPGFFLTNFARDQMTATLLTDVGFRPGVDWARGVGHELGQTDLTRQYNVAGGAIGGMQSAAERQGRLKADINVLRAKGFRVRHFANWSALARVMELSETGTRLGLYERGVERFKGEGMGDWEAAKESAFEARDYLDFDRHGAWPGMRAAARLVPFMNAGLQALDKVARVAGGVKHGSDVLRTLAGGAPVNRAQQSAFDNALKLWIGTATLAAGSLALRAAYGGSPEFDELNDYFRNTGWAMPMGGVDFGIIPKPYEIATPGNALERAYEAATEHDPTALKRLAEGLEQQLVPNHDVSALSIPYNMARNRDALGAPIVQDSMANVRPQFQYTDRTSGFSKKVGELTAGLPFGMEQSPAKLDFLVKSLFSSMGREALAMSSPGKAPIDKALPDVPVLQRFVKDWTRGANSTRHFYELVSGTSGQWTGGVDSVQKLVLGGEIDKAVKFVGSMPDEQRAYTVLQLLGDGPSKDMHPMVRAQKVSSVLAAMAFQIQQGDIRVVTGQGVQTVDVTPHQRRQAVDALHAMAVSEQRNAMIATKAEGWAQRQPLAYDKYVMKLNEAHPQLGLALGERLALTDPNLGSSTATYQAWGKLGPLLAKVPPETLKAALQEKTEAGRAGALRMLEQTVPSR